MAYRERCRHDVSGFDVFDVDKKNRGESFYADGR